jgi:hypothetical protein
VRALLLALASCLCACSSEYQGHYLLGFEASAFVPCGADPKDHHAEYWLQVDDGARAGFSRRWTETTGRTKVRHWRSNQPPGEPLYDTVYVRFRGRSSWMPGRYGHLNGYDHQVTVTELLEMSDGGCP